MSVTYTKAKASLGDDLDRVVNEGARVPITRRGRVVAVVIPVDQAEILQRLEDEADGRAIQEAIDRQGGRPFGDFEEMVRREGWGR